MIKIICWILLMLTGNFVFSQGNDQLVKLKSGWVDEMDFSGRISKRKYYQIQDENNFFLREEMGDLYIKNDSVRELRSVVTKSEEFKYDQDGKLEYVVCWEKNKASYLRYGNLVSIDRTEIFLEKDRNIKDSVTLHLTSHSTDTLVILQIMQDTIRHQLIPKDTLSINLLVPEGTKIIQFMEEKKRFLFPVRIHTGVVDIYAGTIKPGTIISVSGKELNVKRMGFALLELNPENKMKNGKTFRFPLHGDPHRVDISGVKPGRYKAVLTSYQENKKVQFILVVN